MTNTIYTVYKTTNLINNKIYIGVHKTINPNDSYLGSGTILHRAIDKYGKEHFKKEILFEYDNQKDMFEKEILIVDNEFINREDTYNIRLGGSGIKQHSQESKDKISKSKIGKYVGKNHHFFGKQHSQESKDKMSKSSLGKISSQETKDKISKSTSGKTWTQESKDNTTGKNHHKFKGYYITPWGKFESSKLASNENVTQSAIWNWCKNPNRIITNQMIGKSKYLQSLIIPPIGKTYKDLGFNFTFLISPS